MSTLTQIIAIITNRPNYLHHIVLDDSSNLVLVLTQDAHLFSLVDGRWQELTPPEAKALSQSHNHSGSWEMMEEHALGLARV